MREAGYAAATRLDFDLACRALKRWADEREKRTKLVTISDAEQKAKPKKAVPVFKTLAEVLALEPDEARAVARETGLDDEAMDDLADELLGYLSAGRDRE
jgi:hypothetical protein